jgi:hypothetical protein
MTDGLETRHVRALREYADGATRRFDPTSIAQTAAAAAEGRGLRGLVRGWPWVVASGGGARSRGVALVAVLALVTTVALGSQLLGVGPVVPPGGASASPTAVATSPEPSMTTAASPSTPATPAPTVRMEDRIRAPLTDQLSISLAVPAPIAGNGWTPDVYDDFLVASDMLGPQAAEAILFWTEYPDGLRASTCFNHVPDVTEFGAEVAQTQGAEVLVAPEDVSVGGYPATHVAIRVNDDVGCDPGFFYTWRAQTGGPLWIRNYPGDTIRVWLVQVGPTLVFIGAESHQLTAAAARLEREIQAMVDSIRFK